MLESIATILTIVVASIASYFAISGNGVERVGGMFIVASSLLVFWILTL